MAKGRPLRLRPLGIMDVLDETIELYRSNFLILVGITAIMQIPITLLNPMQDVSSLAAGSMDPAAMGGIMAAFVLWIVLYVVVVTPVLTGTLTGAISERYLSRQTTIVDSYKRVLKFATFKELIKANFYVMLGLALYYIAIVVVAMLFAVGLGAMTGFDSGPSAIVVVVLVLMGIAAVIPMIWFWIGVQLAPAIIVVESSRGWDAIKRSLALTKGMIWSILVAYAIAFIVIMILQAVLTAPLQFFLLPQMMGSAGSGSVQMPFWFSLAQAILGSVFAPLVHIVIVLFYYDARVRKEGFDLVMLAEQLDSGARPGISFGETTHPQERDESWRRTEPGLPAQPPKNTPPDLTAPPNDSPEANAQPPKDEAGEPTEQPKDEPV